MLCITLYSTYAHSWSRSIECEGKDRQISCYFDVKTQYFIVYRYTVDLTPMSPGRQLRQFAELIDTVEQSPINMRHIMSEDPVASDERPSISIEAQLPLLPAKTVDDVRISTADITSDGTLDLEFVATVNPAEIDNVSTNEQAAEIQSTDNSDQKTQDSNNQKIQPQNQSSDPRYKDPELLKEVYEAHDTFPEMRRALDVDVTAETVRLHMIEHGIHDPESTIAEARRKSSQTQGQNSTAEVGTGTDDGQTKPTTNGHSNQTVGTNSHDEQTTSVANGHSDEVQTDTKEETTETGLGIPDTDIDIEGVNLPEEVTVEDIVEALSNARTIHEVEVKLGVDREDARELLKRFDMLDAVMGRLRQPNKDDVTDKQIKERVQKAVSS